MDNAIQGLMVLALRGGNGLAALADDVAQEWLRAYRTGGKRPQEKLDTFLNLYRKIKGKRMLLYVHSRRFVPNGNQGGSMKMLNTLRNEFVHFLPRTWSLQVSGLPAICLDCLDVGTFLIDTSGNILWHQKMHRIRAVRAVRRTRSSPSDLRSPLTRRPLGHTGLYFDGLMIKERK
jgi:hypothetical protein